MVMKAKVIPMAVLLVALYCKSGLGQTLPPTILAVDVENLGRFAMKLLF